MDQRLCHAPDIGGRLKAVVLLRNLLGNSNRVVPHSNETALQLFGSVIIHASILTARRHHRSVTIVTRPMALPIGTRLGPYEILARLGVGGMGEVYRAHDARLHRDVAIKLAKAEFSERSAREARLAAALNHTNICQIYDVGPNYLVMEL